MKYSPANYKKDIKRFHELALLLKVKQKDKKAPKNKKIFEKAELEHEKLENKLKKDYEAKHKEELLNLEKEEEKGIKRAEKFEKDKKEYEESDEYKKFIAKPDPETVKRIEEVEKLGDDVDDIVRAERLFDADMREVKEETTIKTEADGTKTIEVKKKLVKPEIYMQEPRYTKNQLRHRKFYEGKDEREDLSEEVKMRLDRTSDGFPSRKRTEKIPPAKFVGKAGGKRKILCCPHCDKEMIATGVKATTADNTRAKTPKMTSWHDLVREVSNIPEYKGKKRPEIMPIASAIKKHYDGDTEKALEAIKGGKITEDNIKLFMSKLSHDL